VRADRGAALVGLVPAAPVLAVLALLVAVVDRQRPLVGLPRVGRDGRPFTLWKLRTMRGPVDDTRSFTVRDDTRITALGARLRRSRLDELPQLWNVARGEMALLGPRPEAPDHVDFDTEGWRAVLATPPGIAGATQVVIHGWESRVDSIDAYRDVVLPHKVEIDRWYVEHASPAVDLDVLRSVLRSVLTPDAATAVHRRLAAALPATMDAISTGTAR
jgi:lipopolysaccharide/colanic/teichoic acid biosynthesis glycosyltransferase